MLLGCALLVAAGSAPSQTLVLCIADDGHVDVEMALEACCTPAGTDALEATDVSLIPGALCDGCTDIALCASPVEPGRPRLNRPVPGIAHVAARGDGQLSSTANAWARVIAAPDMGDPSPARLRTVILLS